MKTLTYLIISVFCVAFAGFSNSEELQPGLLTSGEEYSLMSIDDLQLVVDDQVTDNCLPRPNRLKDIAKLIFRRDGLKINTSDNPYGNRFVISPRGYSFNEEWCAVYVKCSLYISKLIDIGFSYKDDKDNDKTINTYPILQRGGLYVTNKSNMQNVVEDAVEAITENTVLEILKSKDYMKENFPGLLKRIELNKSTIQEEKSQE